MTYWQLNQCLGTYIKNFDKDWAQMQSRYDFTSDTVRFRLETGCQDFAEWSHELLGGEPQPQWSMWASRFAIEIEKLTGYEAPIFSLNDVLADVEYWHNNINDIRLWLKVKKQAPQTPIELPDICQLLDVKLEQAPCKITPLLSLTQFEKESELMQHCAYLYYEKCATRPTFLFHVETGCQRSTLQINLEINKGLKFVQGQHFSVRNSEPHTDNQRIADELVERLNVALNLPQNSYKTKELDKMLRSNRHTLEQMTSTPSLTKIELKAFLKAFPKFKTLKRLANYLEKQKENP